LIALARELLLSDDVLFFEDDPAALGDSVFSSDASPLAVRRAGI